MPAASPLTSFASQTFHFDEDPAHHSDPLLFLIVMRTRILRLTLKRVRFRLISRLRIRPPETIRVRKTGSGGTERKGAQISKQNVGKKDVKRNESQALVAVSQPISGTIRNHYFTQN